MKVVLLPLPMEVDSRGPLTSGKSSFSTSDEVTGRVSRVTRLVRHLRIMRSEGERVDVDRDWCGAERGGAGVKRRDDDF